jgi:hypothetical protein
MSVRIKRIPLIVARYSWDVQISPHGYIGGKSLTRRGALRQGEKELRRRGPNPQVPTVTEVDQ